MNTSPIERNHVPMRVIPLKELVDEFFPKPAKIGSLRPFSTNSTNHDDPTCPETRRCQYLRRTIRCLIENATGKGRDVGGGVGRSEWNSRPNHIRLGKHEAHSVHRPATDSCRNLTNQSTNHSPREVEKLFLKKLGKRLI